MLPFDRLVVEQDAADSATAERLMRQARDRGIEVMLRPAGGGDTLPDALGRSKRVLRVTRHVGAVLRPCTGRTDSLLCCNLRVLTQVVGCPLDCSYCILQTYQNRSEITIRVDPHPILDQLALELQVQPRRLMRVCTGQVADSLALEPLAGLAVPAVERFAALPNAVLELKTKTDAVEPLLPLVHQGRTIVSFSLNPHRVVQQEEHRTASLQRRMQAARRVADVGYLLAFHLDPMVTLDGDPTLHVELVRELARMVPVDRVAYISMGTVRFHPAMRRVVGGRFGASIVTQAELLPDVDGKLRLLSPVRVELYRQVARVVRRCFPEAYLYLCMEPPRVWRQALGVQLASRRELELDFARSLHHRFGLAPVEPRLPDYLED